MVRSLVELSLDKQSFGMSSLTLTPPRQGFILDSEKTFTVKIPPGNKLNHGHGLMNCFDFFSGIGLWQE